MSPPEPDPKVEQREPSATPVLPPGPEKSGREDATGSFAQRVKHEGRRSAAKIAAVYALLGAIWIYSSDWLLLAMISDPHRLTVAQNFKGLAFILGSAVLLYALMRRVARDRERVEVALREHLPVGDTGRWLKASPVCQRKRPDFARRGFHRANR
jgi:hypothetical protein